MALAGRDANKESSNQHHSRGTNNGDHYFFINKSRKSVYLSQSSPAEKAAIQSHVQSGIKRNRPAKSVSVVFDRSTSDEEQRTFSTNSAFSPPNPCSTKGELKHEKYPQNLRSQQEEAEPLGTEGGNEKLARTNVPTIGLLFLDSSEKRSQRDRELEYAQRKAHAATETHRQRRNRPKHALLQSTADRDTPHISINASANDPTWRCLSGNNKQQSRLWGVASPTTQNILSNMDPFITMSVKVDKTVASLLRYYVYYYHPTLWPNEMAVLRHGLYVFESAVSNILRMVVEDELVMYCLLSAAASRFQFIDRLPFIQVAGKEGYYLQHALQLLRSRINSCSFQTPDQSRRLLICIMFLISTEAYRDEVSAAKIHLQAAVMLLKQKGGLNHIEDENLRGQLAMADLYLACVKLEPCLFDCDYDPGCASTLGLDDHELDNLGYKATGASLLDRDIHIIPLKLRVLIGELLESYNVKTQLRTSSMSASRELQVTHWITTRNMAIRHRLLAMATNDSRVHALRVAIIMWTLLSMNVTGRTKTVKIMAPTLQLILAEIPVIGWIDTEDIYLWIILVGFACANEDSEVSAWYAEQCWCFRSVLGPVGLIQDWDDGLEKLEYFQSSFFFDPQVQRSPTRRLARQLFQRQSVQLS
jgi:hypothetical protein